MMEDGPDLEPVGLFADITLLRHGRPQLLLPGIDQALLVRSALLTESTGGQNNMSGGTGEERPLLGPRRGHDDAHQRRVIAVSFAMVILIDLAAFFLDAPQTSILEGIICNRHYNSVPGEHDCTVGPVQAELATVNQLLNTFNRLPGLIVAIPFGILADRYGRRLVIVLPILGALLQDVISKTIFWRPDVFPPRLI
jgi:hypothetical protein